MKDIIQCPNLTNITDETDTKTILKLMKHNYAKLRLAKQFPPRQGAIPNSYVKPKMKDPKRNRVVTSYFKYPMRKLLQLASKALTFCLRNLHKKHRHMCLHRLTDTKHIITKLKHRWHKRFGNDAHVEVIATDVKEMYTSL